MVQLVKEKIKIQTLPLIFTIAGLALLGSGAFILFKAITQRSPSASPQVSQQNAKPAYEANEVLVKFKAGENTEGIVLDVLSKPQLVFTNRITGQHAESTDKDIRDNPQNYEKKLSSPSLLRSAPVFTATSFQESIKQKIVKRAGVTKNIENLLDTTDIQGWRTIMFKEKVDIATLVRTFAAHDGVLVAEPNYIIKTNSLPNDTYIDPDHDGTWSAGVWGQAYEDLWGLKKIQADTAWNASQGSNVVVAVVDTGLDFSHPDIAGNVWQNIGDGGATSWGEDKNHNGKTLIQSGSTWVLDPGDVDGLDTDGNGYVDDLVGWNFSATTTNNNVRDGHGHGTHVAGTIAAIGNNGIGISGVAPLAKIMPVKGLSDTGSGDSALLASALFYAGQNGADVINNSWGCGGPCPSNPVIEDAIRQVYAMGAVVVFAAGNASDDVANYSPVNMIDSKPVVVGASTETDTPASFSNRGKFLDVMAPGGGTFHVNVVLSDRNILSLKSSTCGGLCEYPQLIVGTNYVRQAGTSMAAPHVSGLAALIRANHPSFSNEDIRLAIRASADDIGSPGIDSLTGAGRINAARAVTVSSVLAAHITSPLQGATVSQRDGGVGILGSASGPDFQQYQLFYGLGLNPTTWIPLAGATSTPVTDGTLGTWPTTGLADGTYTLKLVATATSGLLFQDIVQIGLEYNQSIQITSNLGYQDVPQTSGNFIVWDDDRNYATSYYDIYLYDLGPDGKFGTGDCYQPGVCEGERQITTNRYDQVNPVISGNRIVWTDGRLPTYSDIFSCVYDPNTGTCPEEQISTASGNQMLADIDGNRIVWEDTRNTSGIVNWDIYMYDLGPDGRFGTHDCYPLGACEGEQPIAIGSGNQIQPAISGDLIVYSDNTANPSQYHTFVYDLATHAAHQVSSYNREVLPDISGNTVVWEDDRTYGDIYMCIYDRTTGACPEQLVGGNPLTSESQLVPSISGNWIVWHDNRNGDWDVYLYDLLTRRERQLTSSPADQIWPVVSGDRVVWKDFRNGNWDVYTRLTNYPPELTPIGNKTGTLAQAMSFTVAGFDPENESLSYAASNLPPGAAFNSDTRTFSWMPSAAGTYFVTFTVTDPHGLAASQTVGITVVSPPRRGGKNQLESPGEGLDRSAIL